MLFAGHGAEQGGNNYLIPQEFPDKEDLEFAAINQQNTLEKIKSKSPLVTLAILDCCRESAEMRAGYGGGQGLSSLAGPAGSLVMYATGEGGLDRVKLGLCIQSFNSGDGTTIGLYCEDDIAADKFAVKQHSPRSGFTAI